MSDSKQLRLFRRKARRWLRAVKEGHFPKRQALKGRLLFYPSGRAQGNWIPLRELADTVAKLPALHCA